MIDLIFTVLLKITGKRLQNCYGAKILCEVLSPIKVLNLLWSDFKAPKKLNHIAFPNFILIKNIYIKDSKYPLII